MYIIDYSMIVLVSIAINNLKAQSEFENPFINTTAPISDNKFDSLCIHVKSLFINF